jgi:hypothetical protein
VQMNSHNLTQSFGKFEQARDEARKNCINKLCAALSLISFTNKSKMRILVPDVLCQIQKERIGILSRL